MHSSLLLAASVSALALSGLSCSSKSDSSTTPGSTAGALTMLMASDPYTLQPGDEKYFCYAKTLDEDMVFDGFTPTYGNGTHHLLLAEAIAAEPEGFSICNVLFKETWIPLYTGGKGANALHFPDGAGFKVPKGTQVILQLHLQNPSPAAVTASTSVEMNRLDPALPFTRAGIFGMDNRVIQIAPNQTGYSTEMTCTPDNKTMNVFSTLAHMHKLGQHVTVTRNGADTIYDGKWDFNVQSIVSNVLTLSPSDTMKLTCTYDNPTANSIVWGESSDNEMCAFVFYYTPFDALDGCIRDK